MTPLACLQFGEIDIDSELVASKDTLPDSGDQIMMLNNGCMCCSVKEDLVLMLNDLVSSAAPASAGTIWPSKGQWVLRLLLPCTTTPLQDPHYPKSC